MEEKKALINESNYWPYKNNHTSPSFILVSKYVNLKYMANGLNCRTVQRLQKTQASPQLGGKFQQLFGTAKTCKQILLQISFAESANKYYCFLLALDLSLFRAGQRVQAGQEGGEPARRSRRALSAPLQPPGGQSPARTP